MNHKKDERNCLINFLFEMGLLKRLKRSGWWAAGLEDQESVAGHLKSFTRFESGLS